MPSCVLARAHRVFMVWPPPFGRHPCEKPAARLVVGSLEPLVFLWAAIETRLPAQLDQLPHGPPGRAAAVPLPSLPIGGGCRADRPGAFGGGRRESFSFRTGSPTKSHSPSTKKVIRRFYEKSFAVHTKSHSPHNSKAKNGTYGDDFKVTICPVFCSRQLDKVVIDHIGDKSLWRFGSNL